MVLFSTFFLALLIGVTLFPLAMRLSARLELVDVPDERHRHGSPVPRVGGIAIVTASVVPLLIWLESDSLAGALLAGGGVIALMGLADDLWDLSQRWKLAAQVVAAIVAVRAGVVIDVLPFMGLDPVPVWAAWPLTVFCLVAVTNAINLSDGLDGLAGGLGVICVVGIGFLAFEARALDLLIVCLALLGALFAFLRYNSHPATVFMGDMGSQFLGFALAAICIELTQRANGALNPAVPLWLIGVPLIDILLVVVWRLRLGRSPFAADRNHIHYRLRRFGFRHYEAVSAIYLAQVALIGAGVTLRYATDVVSLGAYAAVLAIVVVFFRVARLGELDISAYRRDRIPGFAWLRTWRSQAGFAAVLRWALEAALGAFLLCAGLLAPAVGVGLVGPALAAALLLAGSRWVPARWAPLVARVAIFGAAGVAVFAATILSTDSVVPSWGVNAYFVAFTLALTFAIGTDAGARFVGSTMDVLVLLLAVLIIVLPAGSFLGASMGLALLRLLVLLYCGEFLCMSSASRARLSAMAFAGSAIIVVRGLMMI